MQNRDDITDHTDNTQNETERNIPHRILQDFCKKMENIQYKSCPVCKERSPAMNIVKGTCRRCHTEKKTPKKFSAENNMDPGDVPEELKGLTEIEEMLIAQVFTVMSVYRLRGGQNGYRGNIINFPQDVHEFTKRLPQNPSSLDVLIVQRQSSNETTAYRDFYVH